jgi:FkbM family methyltransferase
MKLKQLFHLLGFRPAAKTFGHAVETIELPKDGRVDYARWLHPRVRPLEMTQGEVDGLRGFLGEGDFAIDIGAHSGDTTLPIALACGASGLVLALEPNPYAYKVLEKNAALNLNKTAIAPLPYAATAADGPLEFRYADEGFCNGGEATASEGWRRGAAFVLKVEGRNLARILRERYADRLPRLRYLKVDVEGHDLDVLQSLEDVITERKPYIRAEVIRYLDQTTRHAMFAFFDRHGYRLHRREGETLAGPLLPDAAAMERRETFDMFAVPGAK